METFSALVPVPADYDGEIPDPSDMGLTGVPSHQPIEVRRITDPNARITDADGKHIYWLGDMDMHLFRYVWDVTP